ncbi:hypothetical protein F4556_000785 [Kitasatospora gansuensis]|uniref:Uncharacterized protein n=1 Tax=Kitasatospora gansuensis TaxID=258050 RepID=A0A7W7S7F3_9ACTN|nr:hypothetical protein [Kitasatospora gansuensis]MBB4945250.1 hypothetical protein [Kitasatospora gansuensis]
MQAEAMNRHQLLAALREFGVSDTVYGINTRDLKSFVYVPEAAPVLAEGLDGRWYISVYERGEQWIEASFDTEAEACAYLYETVTRRWANRPSQG